MHFYFYDVSELVQVFGLLRGLQEGVFHWDHSLGDGRGWVAEVEEVASLDAECGWSLSKGIDFKDEISLSPF